MQNQILVISITVLSSIAFAFTTLITFIVSNDFYYTALRNNWVQDDSSVWWALVSLNVFNLAICLASIKQLHLLTVRQTVHRKVPTITANATLTSTTTSPACATELDIYNVTAYQTQDTDKATFCWHNSLQYQQIINKDSECKENQAAPVVTDKSLDYAIQLDPEYTLKAGSPPASSPAVLLATSPTVNETEYEPSLAEKRKLARRMAFCEKLVTCIQAEYADMELCPRSAATKFHTSKSNFERNVRSYFDDSFMHLLKTYRLHKAAQLLTQGQSVTDVAYEVGFASSNYFSSCFRGEFGVPPTRYQQAKSQYENADDRLLARLAISP